MTSTVHGTATTAPATPSQAAAAFEAASSRRDMRKLALSRTLMRTQVPHQSFICAGTGPYDQCTEYRAASWSSSSRSGSLAW